ncbi:hypothetical protein HDU97_002146 [Phlyctochytrium planicorne]|nr:hypothetical protein HDU97_002146 [Phlyctochytrium planicorne]
MSRDCNILYAVLPKLDLVNCCADPRIGCSSSNETVISLKLSNGTYGGDKVPDLLKYLPNLQLLDFSYGKLVGPLPEFIGNMTGLKQLNLKGNNIGGEIPWFIQNLTNLEYLVLSSTGISGKVPDFFGKLKSLQILDLSGNGMHGTLPESLGSLTSLTLLKLNNNDFTGNIPASYGSLSSCVEFDVSYNRLSGPIPDTLGRLTKAKALWLGANSLTGSIPSSLSNLVQLEKLGVPLNMLSGEIPAGFSSLVSLTEIYLSGNYLQGSIPSNLFSVATRSFDRNCFSENSIQDTTAGNKNQKSQAECDVYYKSLNRETPSQGAPSQETPSQGSPSQGLSAGAVGGIAAVLICVVIIAIFALMYVRRSWQQKSEMKSTPQTETSSLERHFDTPDYLDNFPANESIQCVPVDEPGKFLVAGNSALFPNVATAISTAATTLPVNDLVPFPPPKEKEDSDDKTRQAPPRKAVYNPNESRPALGPLTNLTEASKWTTQQVHQWLISMDVSSRLADILRANGVTGYHLLVITDEQLVQMGIDQLFSRQIVLGVVEQLRGGGGGSSGAMSSDAAAPPQYT